jgi:hypothetical protein
MEVENNNDQNIDLLNHGKFFFFGCWNRRGSENQNKCTDHIVTGIKSAKNHYDFGVILGDNIYPNEKQIKTEPLSVSHNSNTATGTATDTIKVKEKKVFFDSKMEAGIASLESIGLPLHIILGNHDIEDCKMLQYQMNTIPLTKDSNLVNWKFKSNLYSKLYQTNMHQIRLILIDTNLLRRYIPEDQKEKNVTDTDYKTLSEEKCLALDDPRMNINLKKYYAEFKSMLSIDQNKNTNLIIIAGHEPLLCVKQKMRGSMNNESMDQLFFLNDLMTEIAKLYANKIKVVYICADTHCFLDTYIVNKFVALRQIVAGTGGAQPDIYNDPFINDIRTNGRRTKDNQCALIVNDVTNSYGYCSFDVNKFMQEPLICSDKIDPSIVYHRDENNTTKHDCMENQSGGKSLYDRLYVADKRAYKLLQELHGTKDY